MSSGGTQVYFNGQTNTFGTQELRLSTGGPFGEAGDGNQSSHWKDDDLTFQYIGIMDPNIGSGERNPITTNDVNTLDSFGYAVGGSVCDYRLTGAPLFLQTIISLTQQSFKGVSGGTLEDTTKATKEVGEPDMLPGNSGGVGGKSIGIAGRLR